MQDNIRKLTTVWAKRGFGPEDLNADADGTLVDVCRAHGTEAAALPLLVLGDAADPKAQLSLGRTLGKGGMGVVRAAIQVPLQREVAVKTVRAPDGAEAAAGEELIREGRVTGALEHPGVVPIHGLGRNESGEPLLVMKRIDGVAWGELIENPSHPQHPDPNREALDFHLDVLTDVCNVMAFAHSRGVIHRDLKPENIMIGGFGEVYVLDWGLAVSFEPVPKGSVGASGSAPRACDINRVAGTPAYMAPEMAAAEGDRIGVWSDVYLLGAMLHEVLTGLPRHRGDTTMETLLAAFESAPAEFPDHISPQLGGIVNRATHADPTRRYASAAEFRQALIEYREHRASNALCNEAMQRVGVLAGFIGAHASDREVRTTFAECRFGFRQALGTWPANPTAAAGLQRCLELMVGYEQGQGRVAEARALLQHVEQPPLELVERQAALELEARTAGERLEYLQELEHDLDVRVGRRTRSFLSLFIGFVFGLAPILQGWAHHNGVISFGYDWFIGTNIAFAVTTGAVYFWARDTLTATRLNRQISDSITVMTAAMVTLPVGGIFLGLSAAQCLVLLNLVIALTTADLALGVDRRLLLGAGLHGVIFVVSAAHIDWVFTLTGLGIAISSALTAWFWRPDSLVGPYDGHIRPEMRRNAEDPGD